MTTPNNSGKVDGYTKIRILGKNLYIKENRPDDPNILFLRGIFPKSYFSRSFLIKLSSCIFLFIAICIGLGVGLPIIIKLLTSTVDHRCDNNKCQNNATCIGDDTAVDKYKCSCNPVYNGNSPAYNGIYCENYLPCWNEPCKGDGFCTPIANQTYNCSCGSKFQEHSDISSDSSPQCYSQNISVALAFVQLNGNSIAGGFSDNTVRVWSDFSDISTRQFLFGHQDMVQSINVLSDGRIVSGSCDNKIIIWKQGVNYLWSQDQTLTGHTDCVNGLITNISNYLISGSSDQSLIIWKMDSSSKHFSLNQNLNLNSRILALSYLNVNSLLAVGLANSNIHLYKMLDLNQPSFVTNLTGHSDSVLALTFATYLDNPVLASGSKDKLIIIWDLFTYDIKQILQEHSSDVTSLVVLNSGYLASGSADNSINIWDNSTSFSLQSSLFSHYSYVTALLSINNTCMLSASLDTQLIVWKIKTDLTLKYTMNHTNSVQDVIQLPNDQIATGSNDYSVHVWSSQDQINSTVLTSHLDYVYALAYLSDGSIASVSKDVSIRIWNYSTLALSNILYSHEGPVMSIVSINNTIVYSASAQINFITGSCDNSIKIWDNQYRLLDTKVNAHDDCVNALVLYNKLYLVSGGNDSVVKIWSLGSYILLKSTLSPKHVQQVNGLAILQNGNLASCSSDKTIKIWQDSYQNKSLNLIMNNLVVINNTLFVSYSNNLSRFDPYYNITKSISLSEITALGSLANQYLALGFSNGSIEIYTLYLKLVSIPISSHQNSILAFASSNQNFVSVSTDNLLIWKIQTNGLINQLSQTLKDYQNSQTFLSILFYTNIISDSFLALSTRNSISTYEIDSNSNFKLLSQISVTPSVQSMASLKNNQLAFGCQDGTIMIYNQKPFRSLKNLTGHTQSVTSLQTQPVTGNLVSASLDGNIIIWDTIKYEKISSIPTQTNGINQMVMIDQIPIAVLYTDLNLAIWDKTGNFQSIQSLIGHSDAVLDMDVLKNGFLASGSNDTTIKIWDLNLNNIITVTSFSLGHTRPVLAVRTLSNGDLASTSQDRTSKIWYTNLFYNITTFV